MEHNFKEISEALEFLNLPSLITKEDIKRQYRYLAKKYHPDICGENQKMEEINQAYSLLMGYIEHFRYTFSSEEIGRQYPGADYADRFKP